MCTAMSFQYNLEKLRRDNRQIGKSNATGSPTFFFRFGDLKVKAAGPPAAPAPTSTADEAAKAGRASFVTQSPPDEACIELGSDLC